jgi:hypothetical protein
LALWIDMPGNPMPDYLQLYHLEPYLFGTVGPQFRRVGHLSAFDFFCIVIWKANRAKSRIARRLLDKDHKKRKTLDPIVNDLTTAIYCASSGKDRLRILFEAWGFRHPMASAILTVLYPEEFSVYDFRVYSQLPAHERLESKTNFERVWKGYQDFVEAVRNAVPNDMSLRDKDRFLWGRSFYNDLKSDITNGFRNKL